MTNVSFFVPCRNKEAHIAKTVRCVLSQITTKPIEILLSDQGSTDKSLQIMQEHAAAYKGPHTVKVVQCPDTHYSGMAGLNAHLIWLQTQTQADLVLMTSADDLVHPERTEHVVKAFEKHNPDWIATAMVFTNPNTGEVEAMSSSTKEIPQDSEGFISALEVIHSTFGGQCSTAWRKEFFDRYLPTGIECTDVVQPFFAALERGFFYINKPLQIYVNHASEDNTGIEGQMRAAKTSDEKTQLNELGHYHLASNFFSIIRRLQNEYKKIPRDVEDAIMQRAIDSSHVMVQLRDMLTMQKIQPKAFKV